MPFVAHDLYSSTSYNVDVLPLIKNITGQKNDSTFHRKSVSYIFILIPVVFLCQEKPGSFRFADLCKSCYEWQYKRL